LSPAPHDTSEAADHRGGLCALAALSLVAGAVAGLVAGLFRLALVQANACRAALLDWGYGRPLVALPIVVATAAAAAAVAAWMVRRFEPRAAGSGIPDVEAVVAGQVPPERASLIPVKFFGGLLALGAGLALGREGPSVEMGGVAARILGTLARRSWRDLRALVAAGAGAGLATAFGAPLAGVVFVIEEVVRRFELRIAVASLGASAGAIAVADVLLGGRPDFQVAPLAAPPWTQLAFFLVLGLAAGVLGAAYCAAILRSLDAAERLRQLPLEVKAGAIGAAVGGLAWWWPQIVGGGDPLAQSLLGSDFAAGTLLALFGIRFVLGPISYAANTPGGLFAPMLVLGACLGLLAGQASRLGFAAAAPEPLALAVVGMAAFFTAVVRSPLTGIVLVTEMTANTTLLVPMLAANLGAVLVPSLLGIPPIYDSLRARAARLRGERSLSVDRLGRA
jgi:CIC family chloride channel protein